MKQFIKRLFGFSLGPVLGAILSLIQVPIFSSLMPVEEIGNANSFQLLLVNIPNFIYLGLDQSFSREYHLYKDKRKLMQQATLVPFAVGLVLFAIFIIFARPISSWLFKDPSYYYLVYFAGFWVLSTVVERFVLMTIRMEEKAFEYSFYSLLLKVGSFVVSLLLIFMGMRDFTLIVYGLIFGQLLADLCLYIRYWHLLDLRHFSVDQAIISQMLKFGLPIMISTSVASILNMMDTSFLTSVSTLYDRGVYSHAAKIASMFGILKTAFASFWVPTAFRWHKEEKPLKNYQFISDALLLVLTLIFFALLFLKEPIIWLLSSGKTDYLESTYVLGLLCFPHIMYTLSETTTLGISFSRKTYYNIFVSLLALVPSFFLNLLLTPSWGYRGAALASTMAYIVFYLARTYFSRKTGFYFPQKKQVLVTLMMLLAALLNAFPLAWTTLGTIVLAVLALLVQFTTYQTIFAIKNNPKDWDFN
ncbi:lipopolysaccharide biosynthesis protein [Ignavigranum ruoffiae]|uniref:lipopolysaccharide biosynthesis protein n=1 Tax=Ignavigranum ruoffiae TaxID=89093 RepID=UPI0024ACA03C|nr:oligosaccharide flippase family protein [Ignavigranum ruoffiae]